MNIKIETKEDITRKIKEDNIKFWVIIGLGLLSSAVSFFILLTTQ